MRSLLRFILVVALMACLNFAFQIACFSGSVVKIIVGYLSVEMNEDIWDMSNE